MSAIVGPSSVMSPAFSPGKLTTSTSPPITGGNCVSPSFASTSGFNGMSEAPKSTVFAVICAMPPPDPIDW